MCALNQRAVLEIGLMQLQRESERQFSEPLAAEQVACYLDPASRFAEAHAMLNDMEARLRFDVDTARAVLDLFKAGAA